MDGDMSRGVWWLSPRRLLKNGAIWGISGVPLQQTHRKRVYRFEQKKFEGKNIFEHFWATKLLRGALAPPGCLLLKI